MDEEITLPQVIGTVLPSSRTRKIDWELMADTARINPGKWVRTPISLNPAIAQQIRQGKFHYVRPGEFEVTTRKDPDDTEHKGRASFVFIRTRE